MITAQEAIALSDVAKSNKNKEISDFIDKECDEASRLITAAAKAGHDSVSHLFPIERRFPADFIITSIKTKLEQAGFSVARYPVPRSIDGDFRAQIDIAWKR